MARAGEVRLCEALAESMPPQCGGSSLRVEGLDLAELAGLERASGVTWSSRPLQLLGRVAGDVLRVEARASGSAPPPTIDR
ncbi:MAG: hypothetical protein FJZ92_13150 [Chloroflexi bacterium]|nr:hypothetical protein [Chloroflexota bacterium]MBM4435433.1 hypothetical protein [Chloroflexota bacterium]